MNNKFITTVLLTIIIISACNVFCQDSTFFSNDTLISVNNDSLVQSDSLIQVLKEYKIFYYHTTALIEYQEMMLQKYQYIIYSLSGLLFILLVYLFLRFYSRRFVHNFKLFKCKKSEMVPAACMKMILKHWNIRSSMKLLHQQYIVQDNNEIDLEEILKIAAAHHLNSFTLKLDLRTLFEIQIPVLVCYDNHMAIVYKFRNEKIHIADPFYGYIKMDPYYFVNSWYTNKNKERGVGVAFLPDNNMDKKIISLATKLDSLEKVDKKQLKQVKFTFNISDSK